MASAGKPALATTTITLGVSNLNRGIQQINESFNASEGADLKNLWGLAPFGQKFDDPGEPLGPIHYYDEQKANYISRPLETTRQAIRDFFAIDP